MRGGIAERASDKLAELSRLEMANSQGKPKDPRYVVRGVQAVDRGSSRDGGWDISGVLRFSLTVGVSRRDNSRQFITCPFRYSLPVITLTPS